MIYACFTEIFIINVIPNNQKFNPMCQGYVEVTLGHSFRSTHTHTHTHRDGLNAFVPYSFNHHVYPCLKRKGAKVSGLCRGRSDHIASCPVQHHPDGLKALFFSYPLVSILFLLLFCLCVEDGIFSSFCLPLALWEIVIRCQTLQGTGCVS